MRCPRLVQRLRLNILNLTSAQLAVPRQPLVTVVGQETALWAHVADQARPPPART